MKGFVYKITSPSTDKIYIGSTTKTLQTRLITHNSEIKRGKGCMSKLILCFNNAVIECIEEVEFENEKDLRIRERYHIELNRDKCVNQTIPTRTIKEYYIDNADKIKEKRKKYLIVNVDRYKETLKQYRIDNADRINAKIICECGGKHTYSTKSRHLKTKKHQNYIAGII